MKKRNDVTKKQQLVFYLLVSYVVAALLWWGFLLLNKIEENYNISVNQLELQYEDQVTDHALQHKATQFRVLSDTLRKQKMMIFGEGVAFLSLILLGAFVTRRYFLKEIQLAHRQKNFLLSITHELKSPLTSSRLNLETIRLRDLDKEQVLSLVGRTEQDVDRLEQLVQKLLLASRIEDMQQMVCHQPVDLYEVCDSVVAAWQQQPGMEHRIAADLFHVEVMGDADLLRAAVNNLTENAVKYSPPGTVITVRVKMEGQHALISVEDSGKSIPREEYNKIFDRFYRIGNEETRTATGTGLGLYIVKKVALLHGGKVSVREREGGGSVFTISLPYVLRLAGADTRQ